MLVRIQPLQRLSSSVERAPASGAGEREFESLLGHMSNAAEVYIERQVAGALLEALNMDPDDMMEDTVRHVISALEDRGIELRPR